MKNIYFLLLILIFVSCGTPDGVFSSSFENGTPTADIGTEFLQTDNGGNMYVVDNPQKDSINNSNKVLKIIIPPGYKQRAEYHNSIVKRFPTENNTHFYKWKVYYPDDFLSGVDLNWLVVAQWKTWPCEEYGINEMDYSTEICERGGIFNDIQLDDGNELDFRFRASPDCGHLYYTFERGKWVEYVLEVYWTNSDSGYYNLFANAQKVGGANDVKTLFDRFPQDNSCDIYFAVGLYSSWFSKGMDSLYYYIDDINVYYKNNGTKLKDVCPLCAENDTNLDKNRINSESNLSVFSNSTTNFIFSTNEIMVGEIEI